MEDNRTKAQRWSDNIAEFCGSWGFVIWFSAFIGIWVLLNTYMVLFGKFDEYPFILLNLFLTVVSTMQSPIIMMAQNRQIERDHEQERVQAERDRQTLQILGDKLDRLLEK